MIPANYKIVEGHTESLAFFATPPTNTAVQSQEEHIHRPKSQLSPSASVLEFKVDGSAAYLDLCKTRLNVQVRITRQDGSTLQPKDNCALTNLALHSLFGQVDVTLNQIPINKIPAPLHSIKSYTDALLENGEDAKESYLQGQLWYADTPGHMDSFKVLGDDQDAGLNEGLVARYSYTKGSRICEMEGPLTVDFFQQPRYLLNNISVGIRLWHNPNPWRLMADVSDHTYKVEIVDASLKCTAVTIAPEIIVSNEECLAQSPAIYPYYQSDFKVYNIAKGDRFFSADGLWEGNMPSKAIVMLTASEAYNGAYHRNCYNFANAHLNSLSFQVNGVCKPAAKPLTPDYENDMYTESYMTLFTSTNMIGKNTGNDISHYAYKNGYTVYAFDLDGHSRNKDYLPLPKRAHIRIEAKFAKPLEESMSLIVYGKFPRVIKIDKGRNIFM